MATQDLASLLKLTNGTNTIITPNAQAAAALRAILSGGANLGNTFSKQSALADTAQSNVDILNAINAAMPTINSATLGSGMRSGTTNQLLKNNLDQQILLAQQAATSQRVKDYQNILNQAQQVQVQAAQGMGQTTQEQGMGVGGLLGNMAMYKGAEYGLNALSSSLGGGSGVATTGAGTEAVTASTAGTGGSLLGNITDAVGLTTSRQSALAAANSAEAAATGAQVVGAAQAAEAANLAAADAATFGADTASWLASDGAASTAASAGAEAAGSSVFSSVGSYMPYIAAAVIVDKLTGGELSKGITSASDVLGIKKPIDNLWQGGSDALTGLAESTGTKTVLCTAAYNLGEITLADVEASVAYKNSSIDQISYLYYLQWATPQANYLRKVGKYTVRGRLLLSCVKAYVRFVKGDAGLLTSIAVRTGLKLNSMLAHRAATKLFATTN